MSEAYLHLLLNHFPAVAALVAVGLLIAGLVSRNNGIVRSALIVLILSALVTIPVFLTGEGAEEVVEHIEGVTHDSIEEHEEMGEKAMWIMEGMGVLALISLILNYRRHALARLITILTLLTALVAFGMMWRTGQTGSHIRHTEIKE
jgi:uncharacterized membrane protein